MISIRSLVVFANLLRAATALSLPTGSILVNNIVVPHEKYDFAKQGVGAHWASEYPKEWGSEDYHYQFNDPDPDGVFSSTITADEKYLAMSNGTHVTFVDLETRSTASVFALAMPDGNLISGLMFHLAQHGGYHMFASGVPYEAIKTLRMPLSSHLKPLEDSSIYSGRVGDISKQGKLALLQGSLYDLEGANTPVATLADPTGITGLSFSPDGVHLAALGYWADTLDLWNATSGQRIHQFPKTGVQNWVTQFSGDGQYIAYAMSGRKNTVQVFAVGNLTAPPIELSDFNFWPRHLAWSQDGKKLAVADHDRLRVFSIPSREMVQTWEIKNWDQEGAEPGYELSDVSFLDGGNKITWVYRAGRYLYDFETNTKWYWTPRTSDHAWGGMGFSFLSNMDMVVTHDGDATVRFWKLGGHLSARLHSHM